MTKYRPNRREFLLGSLATGVGLGSLGGLNPLMRLARAADGTDGNGDQRYYIFCYFPGGWDVLLSLDPRDPTLFTEDNKNETRILPGYERLDTTDLTVPVYNKYLMNGQWHGLGAYLGEMGTEDKYRSQMSIVRGINMETLSHDTGRRRFSTGKPPAGVQARGSSAATWLASQFGEQNLIPNLSVRVESFNQDQPTYASAMGFSSVSDMLQALRPNDPLLNANVQLQVDELIAHAAHCETGLRSKFVQNAHESRMKAIEMVASGLESKFDFLAQTDEMDKLRDRFGFARNTNGLNSSQARAALAARAITSGVSRSVSVAIAGGGLDTHDDNWETNQGPNQREGFNSIARIIDELSETPHPDGKSSWMDHTNIVAFSEFSRTPMLNLRGGRDHWLMNACMVLGADVKGGQIIGASSDEGMEPVACNLGTGQTELGGTVLKPEHVIQTLFHGAGITDDPADLRCEAIDALLK
jgi:hypothetical protein